MAIFLFFIFVFVFYKKNIFSSAAHAPLSKKGIPTARWRPQDGTDGPIPTAPVGRGSMYSCTPGAGAARPPPLAHRKPTHRKEGRRRRRRAATPPRLCARRLKQAAALFYFYPSLLICLPLLPSPHRSLLLLLISRESIRIAAIHPLRIYLASYCSLLHYPICRAGAMRYCC